MLFATLAYTTYATLVISYDIVCQWSVNLFKRMNLLPPAMRIDTAQTLLRPFIPSAHIPMHGTRCRSLYSFNLRPHVGRLHGETIEQEWGHIGQTAVSTREMGPGARHATLDDHWGNWNWRKQANMGESWFDPLILNVTNGAAGKHFVQHLPEAVDMRTKQGAVFEKLTSTFPSSTIKRWEEAIRLWEKDSSKPDPYTEPECSV